MRAKTPEEMRVAREAMFTTEFFCPHGQMYQRVQMPGGKIKIKKTNDCPNCITDKKKRALEDKKAKRIAERLKADQERAARVGTSFNRQRQRERWEELLREAKARLLVTVDQEDKREDGLGSDLVMSFDGVTQQPWDEQLIPDNAIVV